MRDYNDPIRRGGASRENETMTSVLSVFNVLVLIIFDTGASYSFMSDTFRRRLT